MSVRCSRWRASCPVVAKLPQGLATPLGEGGALLSAGEAQRVRLGRAMLRKHPRLVVLDEPFLGLERDRRRTLLAHARQRWAASTLLYVTHDVVETRAFDRVFVMEHGRIVEDGEPLHLAQTPSSRYRRLLAGAGSRAEPDRRERRLETDSTRVGPDRQRPREKPMNRLPDADAAALADAAWPSAQGRRGDVRARAPRRAAGRLRVKPSRCPTILPIERLNGWIETAAEQCGRFRPTRPSSTLDEIDGLLSHGAPALIRLAALEGAPFLAVLGRRGRFVRALGPDLRGSSTCASRAVAAAVRRPFEAPVEADIDRDRRAMCTDRTISNARARGHDRRSAQAGAIPRLLARASPAGRADRATRRAKRIADATGDAGRRARRPVRAVRPVVVAARPRRVERHHRSRWLCGMAAAAGVAHSRSVSSPRGIRASRPLSVGAWLRRRLLRGAFMVDRQELRQKGGGQLFGLVIEAAAIDALALTGGIFATFSLIELAIASVVLWAGAGALAAPLLAGWALVVGYLALELFSTRERSGRPSGSAMTQHLLECMVGHRTRLAQQPEEERHHQEDEVARSIHRSEATRWIAPRSG